MPKATDADAPSNIKTINVGDSGSGKTGSLCSLADAGYKVRILDLDNNAKIIRNIFQSPKCPYKPGSADNIEWVTVREPMRNVAGQIMPAKASMWLDAMKQLMEWKDGERNLGNVNTWGSDCVLVVDTLTTLSRGAYNFILAQNGKLGQIVTGYDYQRMLGQTQALLENFIDLIADASIKCNVIVNSHITYIRDPGEAAPRDDKEADKVHGFPTAIGQALSKRVARAFDSLLHYKIDGFGAMARPKIYTVNQGLINTKTSNPLAVAKEYSIERGLAEYFAAVRGTQP